jgi:hypothetical protein
MKVQQRGSDAADLPEPLGFRAISSNPARLTKAAGNRQLGRTDIACAAMTVLNTR